VREKIFPKAEGMRVKRDRIPDKVLKEIFPKKMSRFQPSDEVYTQLKTMILSAKLKKGEKLTQGEIVQRFNLNWAAVGVAFSRLKKEKLIITKKGIGSFVV
jgi:DNA-binding GntR family transcriptional regulator